MMKGIQEAYWIAKEKNKKYTPKKIPEITLDVLFFGQCI